MPTVCFSESWFAESENETSVGRLVLTVPCFTKIGSPLNPRKVVLCVIGSDDETAVGRLVVTGVTVPQYGVEGKHAVLYCRS